MKKIGIVLSQPPVYSETFLNNKIKNLMQSGFNVTVFSQQGKGKYFFKHITAFPTDKMSGKIYFFPVLLYTFLFAPKLFVKLFFLNRKEKKNFFETIKNIYINAHFLLHKVDVLHFEFSVLAIGRELVAKTINARMTCSFRGYDVAIYPLKKPESLNLVWKYLDKIHTISDDLIYIAKQHGLPPKIPVEKIFPAIDTNFFHYINEKKQNEKLTIVSVGRLHWKKGYTYAIQAMKILQKKNILFEFHVIGDGEQREELLYMINQLGLEKNIFLHGKKTQEEIFAIYSKTDIYIQPSVQEGFCNAVLEAQSAGLLCIVTNAEGLEENVLNNETGFVIEKRNSQQLAEKIMEVKNISSERKKEISEKASDRVTKEFTLEIQKKKFEDFYKNIA